MYRETSKKGCSGAIERFGIDLLVWQFKQSCVSIAIHVLMFGK